MKEGSQHWRGLRDVQVFDSRHTFSTDCMRELMSASIVLRLDWRSAAEVVWRRMMLAEAAAAQKTMFLMATILNDVVVIRREK